MDGGGRLAEVGWQKFPRLMHLAWGAQWLDYTHRLAANLSRPALELPVFRHQVPPPPLSGPEQVICRLNLHLIVPIGRR